MLLHQLINAVRVYMPNADISTTIGEFTAHMGDIMWPDFLDSLSKYTKASDDVLTHIFNEKEATLHDVTVFLQYHAESVSIFGEATLAKALEARMKPAEPFPHVGVIRNHIFEFAKEHKLQINSDILTNVLKRATATPDYYDLAGVFPVASLHTINLKGFADSVEEKGDE